MLEVAFEVNFIFSNAQGYSYKQSAPLIARKDLQASVADTKAMTNVVMCLFCVKFSSYESIMSSVDF